MAQGRYYNNLPRLGKAIRDAVNTRRHQTADDLRDIMKEEAPRETGELEESIESIPQGDNTDLVRVGAEHGVFVNNGHHAPDGTWVPANPFVDRAVARVRPTLDKRYTRLL